MGMSRLSARCRMRSRRWRRCWRDGTWRWIGAVAGRSADGIATRRCRNVIAIGFMMPRANDDIIAIRLMMPRANDDIIAIRLMMSRTDDQIISIWFMMMAEMIVDDDETGR